MTKRLCIVTEEFGDVGGFGGLGHSTLGIMESSVDAGFYVDIVLTSCDRGASNLEEFRKNKKINIILLADVFAENAEIKIEKSNPAVSYHIFKYILRRNYESVHFQDLEGYGFYSALARRQGILGSVVVTHLNGSSQWLREIVGGVVSLPDLEQEAMERAQVANSDLILTQSAATLSWYKAQGVDLPRSEFVTRPLPKWAQESSTANQAEDAVQRQVGRTLIFCGRQNRQDGFDIFLETVATLPDNFNPDIWIIGPFDRIQGEFSGSLALRKLADRVSQLNFLPSLSFRQAISEIRNLKGALCVLPFRANRSPFVLDVLKAFQIPFVTCSEQMSSAGNPLSRVGDIDHSPTRESLHRAMLEMTIARDGSRPSNAEPIAPQILWPDVLNIIELLAVEEDTSPPANQLPLVSCCLVHHERPRLLALAIDALMEQTYSNIEIIVVDDGSQTPEAIAYLKRLEQSEFRFPLQVIRSANRYLGAARNLAAAHAKGDFIVFHDDDNISEKNQIQDFVHAAARTNSDILTCFNYSFANDGAIPAGNKVINLFPTCVESLYSFFSNRFGDANALFRRSTFLELGGFTEYRGVGWEDWEIFLRASIRGKKINVVPLPLFNYRVNDDGMLASGNLAKNFDRIFALIDEERPRFRSDILRLANRDLLLAESKKAQLALCKREPFGELHQELMGLDPGSQEAQEKLLELANSLGWDCRGNPIAFSTESNQPNTSTHLSLNKPPAGLNLLIIHDADLKRGERLLLFRGWSRSKDNDCVVPKGMRIGGRYYHRCAYSTQHRQDLVDHFKLNPGQGELGFIIACKESKPPSRRWFRSGFLPVSIPGQIDAAAFLNSEKAKALHIDEIQNFREVSFEVPLKEWRGIIKITAKETSPLFHLTSDNSYREVTDTGFNYRMFRTDFPGDVKIIRLLVPENQKITIICE